MHWLDEDAGGRCRGCRRAVGARPAAGIDGACIPSFSAALILLLCAVPYAVRCRENSD